MEYDANYYDKKWQRVISGMPNGHDYRFDLRSYGYNLIIDQIKPDSKVFDYACGLSVLGKMIKDKTRSKVNGCDFSKVAVDYAARS